MLLSLAACCLLVILPVWGGLNPASASEEASAQEFATSVLAFRKSAAEGEGSAMVVLSEMPGAAKAPWAILPALWSPFFENAIVKLGRLNANVPAALFYNPLLDLALFTLWQRHGDAYSVHRARALPGERLQEPQAPVSLLPAWIGAEASPMETLVSIALGRLETFRGQHPADSDEAGRISTSFADAAANTRDVLARLAWNTAQRLEWTDAGLPWLEATLADVERALNAGDARQILALALETDMETAAALARLPANFVEGLSLDMAVGAGGAANLLIGSVPQDGGVYILAICLMDGDHCALRRIALLALTG